MLVVESLRQGDLTGSLREVQQQVREHPEEARHRILLFQLLAVVGDWARAATQLDVLADLHAPALPMARTYREAVRAELLRAEVFAGRKTPVIFGEPESWMAVLLEAVRQGAAGRFAEAGRLRDLAFEDAPETPGTIDGTAFSWLADTDTRMGPMLEAIVDGRYWWVPFQRVRSVRLEAPADLRDLVWAPASLTWTNGGDKVALLPARYPRSESHEDAAIRLGRRTEWVEREGGGLEGLGQRMLATDVGEHPLLEIREILLETAGPAAPVG
jgi:type VI secretion system protein ImpE